MPIISESEISSINSKVIEWADSTFYKYDEPRFEEHRAFYTEEYQMAFMRVSSYDKSISRLEKSKENGNFKGTSEEYNQNILDISERKKDAEKNLKDFHPKVTHYSVIFWANIKLDSGIFNYVQHEIHLNENLHVINNKIIGNIGDNSDAKIIYK